MTLVAVTGSTGFVGAASVTAFRADGRSRLRVLLRSPGPDAEGADVVVGGLTDADAPARLVEGADVVVHLAGLVRSTDTAALQAVNIGGTKSLLEAAGRAGVRRFVLVSSTGVYGRPGTETDESGARRPRNPYERSKAAAEALVLTERGCPEIVVVQPSNVIGVGAPTRPLRRFLARVRAGRRVIHAGAWTNYVDVRDVARVIVAAATSPQVPEILIVNAPQPLETFAYLAGEATGMAGRSIGLPPAIGSLLAPIVSAASGPIPSLERVLAVLDRTRFVTANRAWFSDNGIDLSLEPALSAMAIDYGLASPT